MQKQTLYIGKLNKKNTMSGLQLGTRVGILGLVAA